MQDELLKFRYAVEEDTALILRFIKLLASYENMEDEVIATEKLLQEWIFKKNKSNVIFAMISDIEIGFALFSYNFSTFLGKSGIYLEDLFILPEYRRKGYGKAFMRHLAQIAIEQGYGRLEWCCLNWNIDSINFYLSLDAKVLNDRTSYQITGESLKKLAN